MINLLSLSQMTGTLLFNINALTQSMNAIQRIEDQVDFDEFEANFDAPQPQKDWPNTGKISIKNISIRYRKNLPLVLDNISFEIVPNENIGIVGRTGSGKSTFLLAVTRLLELAENENCDSQVPKLGTIEIDGVDISKIGLHHLRKIITTIPQDPLLFEGKLKFSIDPLGLHSEEEIVRAVKLVGLDETIQGNILEHEIESSGKNLSLGQRQLLAFARAILSSPKILLLDEATSNIDKKTDLKIQNIIRNEFKNSTVITIAHRLDTVMDYDKIIVLDNGKLAEMGSVKELIERKNSIFSGMVQEQREK